MEKIRHWGTDISCWIVSFFCYFTDLLKWFTPAHCEHVSQIIAMLIGILTLFFITIPKAVPNMRRIFKRTKTRRVKP